MGYLLIDNRDGLNLPGLPASKVEYETASCVHCGGVIAIFARANEHHFLSSLDIARATPLARDAPPSYVAKYRCTRCHDNICRACAQAMEATGGTCPGPFKALLDAALGGNKSQKPFAYRR